MSTRMPKLTTCAKSQVGAVLAVLLLAGCANRP